ncbi:MAG: DUF1700 domain-containing protein [Clostridiales bacterium]|nr:DUF1700 domain-containing protein [Clostridiales bacterium]
MNKKDYISALRAQLKRLPSDDVEDIVKEFETHFEIGISEGKKESEIAAKLGSPEEVAQIYLSDSIPAFDMANVQNACPPVMPMVPVKTGMVIDRGVGPQTAAGFATGGYAKPLQNASPKNGSPKPEPDGPLAHKGAKDHEEYVKTGAQTGKKVDLPDYSQYPTQDPSHVVPASKEHNTLFAVLFTIFVFIPAWILALALLIALIAWPVVTGIGTVLLFSWVPGLSAGVAAGTICLGISTALATIGEILVVFFAIKWFVLGTIAYIRYIGKIMSKDSKGGNA